MLLSKGIAAAATFLRDDNVAVVKRAMQATVGLYRQSIISLSRPQRIHSPKVCVRERER